MTPCCSPMCEALLTFNSIPRLFNASDNCVSHEGWHKRDREGARFHKCRLVRPQVQHPRWTTPATYNCGNDALCRFSSKVMSCFDGRDVTGALFEAPLRTGAYDASHACWAVDVGNSWGRIPRRDTRLEPTQSDLLNELSIATKYTPVTADGYTQSNKDKLPHRHRYNPSAVTTPTLPLITGTGPSDRETLVVLLAIPLPLHGILRCKLTADLRADSTTNSADPDGTGGCRRRCSRLVLPLCDLVAVVVPIVLIVRQV